MLEHGPLDTEAALLRCADEAWAGLSPDEQAAAIRAHPRIGEPSLSGWQRQEQQSTEEIGAELRAAFAAANRRYEDRFGVRFVVDASGRSAAQLLTAIEDRLANPPEIELELARRECHRITRRRLRKLVGA
jgi:2-oxo-4-hydroxy-4-carboxy-5-ureidoimidazoline decarboxylase